MTQDELKQQAALRALDYVVDGTIVGVALPTIISDLELNLTDAQWVNSLYAVVLAALLLSTGRLADRWGRKRTAARQNPLPAKNC